MLTRSNPFIRDTRELVSELEFVWDQIKSNPPSSSSSASYPIPGQPLPLDTSPPSSPTASKILPGTYPTTTTTSEDHGATAPSSRKSRSARDSLEPIRITTPAASHVDDGSGRDEAEAEAEAEIAKSPETPGLEVFVDAPDSQPDYDHDNQTDTSPVSRSDDHSHNDASSLPPSPSRVPPSILHAHTKQPDPPRPQQQPQQPQPGPQSNPITTTPRRDLQAAAGALIAPFAAYITKSKPKPKPTTLSTATPGSAPTIPPPSPQTNANPSNTTSHPAPHPNLNTGTGVIATSQAPTQKWQRRVEASLIKLTAELAALREQLEMQHQLSSSTAAGAHGGGGGGGGGVASSLLHNPFSSTRRSFASVMGSGSPSSTGGIAGISSAAARLSGRGRTRPTSLMVLSTLCTLSWTLLSRLLRLLLRTLAIDAMLLAALVAWMRWKGVRAEVAAGEVLKWARRIRERSERVGRGVGRGVGGLLAGPAGGLQVGLGGLVGRGGVRFLPGRDGGWGFRRGGDGLI